MRRGREGQGLGGRAAAMRILQVGLLIVGGGTLALMSMLLMLTSGVDKTSSSVGCQWLAVNLGFSRMR